MSRLFRRQSGPEHQPRADQWTLNPRPLPLAPRRATTPTPTGSNPIYADSSTQSEAHSGVETSTQAGVEAVEKVAQWEASNTVAAQAQTEGDATCDGSALVDGCTQCDISESVEKESHPVELESQRGPNS